MSAGISLPKDLISIVLVNPKRPSNIGSVARAMNCMGFYDLVLVQPRCQIDRYAFMLATGSADILEKARVFDSLSEALSGYGLVLGTTRRIGKRRHNFITARESADMIVSRYRNSRVAILFGPEDYGLSRAHLAMCQYLVSIPTGDGFGSLNLSQAVMILCYELFLAFQSTSKRSGKKKDNDIQGDLSILYRMTEKTLREIKFPARRGVDHAAGHLKEIFARAEITRWEAEFLLGIFRHLRFMSSCIRQDDEITEEVIDSPGGDV
ncbi:MAG: RNA methyltransferase [Candidatus Xenobiia bacterium LiM19]